MLASNIWGMLLTLWTAGPESVLAAPSNNKSKGNVGPNYQRIWREYDLDFGDIQLGDRGWFNVDIRTYKPGHHDASSYPPTSPADWTGKELLFQYQKHWGFEDYERRTRIRKDSAYRLGRPSLMFTATIVMSLIDEGRLKLSDTVKMFFPDRKIPYAGRMTIEHLLAEESGIARIDDDESVQEDPVPQTRERFFQWLKLQTSMAEPGERFNYNTSGYKLLTYIIEDVTKKPFGDVLKERIVDKAGLQNTYYGKPQPGEARSYVKYGGAWQAMFRVPRETVSGAGGIVSTADDMHKFMQALFSAKLCSAESLELMMTPRPVARKRTLRVMPCMGLHKVWEGDHYGWGQFGEIDAFHSSAVYFPKKPGNNDGGDLFFVALCNGQNLDIDWYSFEITSWMAPAVEYYGERRERPDGERRWGIFGGKEALARKLQLAARGDGEDEPSD